MRKGLQGVTFIEPPGFDDETVYKFADEHGREWVDVCCDFTPAQAESVYDLLQERRDDIELAAEGADITIEGESEIAVGPLSGRMLSFTGTEDGFRFRVWSALAILDEVSYVSVSCMAPAHSKKHAARLERILGSVSLIDQKSVESDAADGFVRRLAGRISLEVPSDLKPPGTFRFASPTRQTQLKISVYDGRDPSRRPPSLESEVESENASGAVVSDRGSTAVSIDGSTGTAVKYRVTKDEILGEETFAVVMAQLVFRDGVLVTLKGRAPQAAAAALERSFNEMLHSISRSN